MTVGPSRPAIAGIGLRSAHIEAFLALTSGPTPLLTPEPPPELPLIELHSENYLAEGGHALDVLAQLATRAPLSLHGVGLSLGSADRLDERHLQRLRALVERVKPRFVSEHLSWGRIDQHHSHELLPLPMHQTSVQLLCERIDRVQQVLGRELLVENISAYLACDDDAMPEWEFVAEIVERSGCGLLLDVNNVYVNSVNFAFDPLAYLAAMPWPRVRELHVAGHEQVGELLIDTHGSSVIAPVQDLLQQAMRRAPDAVALLERDSHLPSLPALLAEARAVVTNAENVAEVA